MLMSRVNHCNISPNIMGSVKSWLENPWSYLAGRRSLVPTCEKQRQGPQDKCCHSFNCLTLRRLTHNTLILHYAPKWAWSFGVTFNEKKKSMPCLVLHCLALPCLALEIVYVPGKKRGKWFLRVLRDFLPSGRHSRLLLHSPPISCLVSVSFLYFLVWVLSG